MALRKLERRNYGRKLPVSIKYENIHTFKEGLILLCQSILKTRRITHLHGSSHFTITFKHPMSLAESLEASMTLSNGRHQNTEMFCFFIQYQFCGKHYQIFTISSFYA